MPGVPAGKVTQAELAPGSPDLQRCILLDNLAHRYGLLPSEVLLRADTLDIMVADVVLSYEAWQREQQDAKNSGRAPRPPDIPINTLQAMLERTKQNHGRKDH